MALPTAVQLDRTILALGSPTATTLARFALGYDRVVSGNKGALERDQNSRAELFLPVEYYLNPTATDVVLRKYQEKLQYVPNYGVGFADGKTLYPEFDRSGNLISDYLLVSCIPNILGHHFGSNENIIVAGGPHGLGTEAFYLVLSNKEIFGQLAYRVRSYKYWQALFRVSRVETEALGDVKAMEFDKTFDVYEVQFHKTAGM